MNYFDYFRTVLSILTKTNVSVLTRFKEAIEVNNHPYKDLTLLLVSKRINELNS